MGDESELDKWGRVHTQANVIQDYLDWYEAQPQRVKDMSREDRVYAYFGINVGKLEEERQELLKQIREEKDG